MKNRKRFAISIMGMGLLFILTACYPNQKNVQKEIQIAISKTDLQPYIKQLSVEIESKHGPIYPVYINIKLKDSFIDLNKSKQFYTMAHASQAVATMKQSVCDECDYMRIEAKNGDRRFQIYPDSDIEMNSVSVYDDSDPLKDPDILSKIFLDEGDNQTEKQTSTETNDSSTITTDSRAVTDYEWGIHEYMKSLYDKLTNYGENYTPEIDDPKVAQMAAEHFGITEKEAGDIYVKVEMAKTRTQ